MAHCPVKHGHDDFDEWWERVGLPEYLHTVSGRWPPERGEPKSLSERAWWAADRHAKQHEAEIAQLTRLVENDCELDTEIRNLARPILGVLATDGDVTGVPSTVDIVEQLCKEIARINAAGENLHAKLREVTAERDRLLAERK